jgi:hypothetical protein
MRLAEEAGLEFVKNRDQTELVITH